MLWLDLVIRIAVVGLGVWAIKWGLAQQIKCIKKSIPELPDCAKEHKEIKKHYTEEINRMGSLMDNDLSHVAELISKDLKQGQQKFKEHGKSIEEIKNMINDMRVSLATIAKNGQKQSGSTVQGL